MEGLSKLAEEIRKMGEIMAVAEISTEIREGFRKLTLVVALSFLTSTLLLGSIACFIASYFSEGKVLIICGILLEIITICLLCFIFGAISSRDKGEVSGSDVEVKEELQHQNEIIEFETD